MFVVSARAGSIYLTVPLGSEIYWQQRIGVRQQELQISASDKLSSPKRELVVGRVVRQVGRRRAIGIHDVYLPVAVAIGLKGNLQAVR